MAKSVDPDQTVPIGAVWSGSTLFASIFNSSVMLGNYLQQTTSADDIFTDVFFFLDALRVKVTKSAFMNIFRGKNLFKVGKRAKITNRYNQAPHLTQDANEKVKTSHLDITNESQEVSHFPFVKKRKELKYAFTINVLTTAENCMKKEFSYKNRCAFLLLVIICVRPEILDI